MARITHHDAGKNYPCLLEGFFKRWHKNREGGEAEGEVSNLPNDHMNRQKMVGQVLSDLHSACLPFLSTHLGLNVVSICMNMGNALLKSACALACKSSK